MRTTGLTITDFFRLRNNSARHGWPGEPGGGGGGSEGAHQVFRHLQREASEADSEGSGPHQGTPQGRDN